MCNEHILVDVVFTKALLAYVILLTTLWWMFFSLKSFWCMLFYKRHFGACYSTNNFLVHVIFAKDILVHVF